MTIVLCDSIQAESLPIVSAIITVVVTSLVTGFFVVWNISKFRSQHINWTKIEPQSVIFVPNRVFQQIAVTGLTDQIPNQQPLGILIGERMKQISDLIVACNDSRRLELARIFASGVIRVLQRRQECGKLHLTEDLPESFTEGLEDS
jgi:hypothetical protein